jgi:hypothetical protein
MRGREFDFQDGFDRVDLDAVIVSENAEELLGRFFRYI